MPLVTPPRPSPRTKQAFVYETLRQDIMQCVLAPGERLVIDDLARRLNVSTIPVREALQILQTEGLILNVPHVGATVAPITRESIVDVFSMLEGLELVATEMPAPIGPEFRLLFDRQNYGMPMPEALHAFAERVPVLDAKFFVTAVLIQRESGGNLSEVLDNLSTVIRERQRVKGQMRVLSAHGRITGWVLVGLAPALGFFLMSSSPPHREALIGTSLGIKMLIAAAALQVIGTYLISRIVDVEY